MINPNFSGKSKSKTILRDGQCGLKSVVMKLCHETLLPFPSMASSQWIHLPARRTDTSEGPRPVRGARIRLHILA